MKSFFRDIAKALEGCLKRTVEQGQLAKSTDISSLATYLVTEFRTALLLASSGGSRREIEQHLEVALQVFHSIVKERLVSVVLRPTREQRQDLDDLGDIFVDGQYGKVPLNSVAEVIPSWQPAILARRDDLTTVTVGAGVACNIFRSTK